MKRYELFGSVQRKMEHLDTESYGTRVSREKYLYGTGSSKGHIQYEDPARKRFVIDELRKNCWNYPRSVPAVSSTGDI
jgi:hypothetical protein